MKNVFAYARVSSRDQNLARQLDSFKEENVPEDHIYTDQQSGKDFNRPGWKALLKVIQPGDLIIIKSLDRLSRNYNEITEMWHHLTKELGVDIKVLDMPLLDTTVAKDILGSFVTDLILQILSFQAETERANIKERQAQGIAAAKVRGVQFGRPRKPDPENFDEIYHRWKAGESISSLAREYSKFYSLSTLRTRILNYQDEND